MCTLPPDGLVGRLDEFSAVFAESLVGVEREPLSLRLVFVAGAEARVREVFAAEQVCCAFLTFVFERSEVGLVVSVRAPEEAGHTLDGFQALAEGASTPVDVARGWTG